MDRVEVQKNWNGNKMRLMRNCKVIQKNHSCPLAFLAKIRQILCQAVTFIAAYINRVGKNCIYIRCIHGISGREITKYIRSYTVHIHTRRVGQNRIYTYTVYDLPYVWYFPYQK